MKAGTYLKVPILLAMKKPRRNRSGTEEKLHGILKPGLRVISGIPARDCAEVSWPSCLDTLETDFQKDQHKRRGTEE